jgi:hypothetical protein
MNEATAVVIVILTTFGFIILLLPPGSVSQVAGVRRLTDPIGAFALLVGSIGWMTWSVQAILFTWRRPSRE